MKLKNYTPLCDALVLLLQPLVEVVIHDLKSGAICYINGGISKRGVGDPSLLDPEILETDLDKIVYPKLNFDGRLVKSISVPLGDRFLVCMNCDVSIFETMQQWSAGFLASTPKPKSLFQNDWQEKLHIEIHGFLKGKNWSFETLTRPQKKLLVQHLFRLNVFGEKNAADYVADVLGMGRATIFKYLKEWKSHETL